MQNSNFNFLNLINIKKNTIIIYHGCIKAGQFTNNFIENITTNFQHFKYEISNNDINYKLIASQLILRIIGLRIPYYNNKYDLYEKNSNQYIFLNQLDKNKEKLTMVLRQTINDFQLNNFKILNNLNNESYLNDYLPTLQIKKCSKPTLTQITHSLRDSIIFDIGDVFSKKSNGIMAQEYIEKDLIIITELLILHNIKIAFITGKPLAEVKNLFAKNITDPNKLSYYLNNIFIYSYGGTVATIPIEIDPNNGKILDYFSNATITQIQAVIKSLESYGLQVSYIYTNKSDLKTFTQNKRTFEIYNDYKLRINVTALGGSDPLNPNNIVFDDKDSRIETSIILNNIFQVNNIKAVAKVAGRIGLDLLPIGKEVAKIDFEDKYMNIIRDEISTNIIKNHNYLANQKPEFCSSTLKIIDLYNYGFGADADFVDNCSFSVGDNDNAFDNDTNAPIFYKGGVKSTLKILTEINWFDIINKKIFNINSEGKIKYKLT